jgi:hypothetical protein
MEKPMKKTKVTHRTCNDFTDSKGDFDSNNDSSCNEGVNGITNIITMQNASKIKVEGTNFVRGC